MGRPNPNFIDPNNVDYRDSWPSVGTLSHVSHNAPYLTLAGVVDNAVADGAILVLDSAGRFIATKPAATAGSFAILIPDRHLQTSSWPLRVYLYDGINNVGMPIANNLPEDSVSGAKIDIPSMKPRNIETLRVAMGQVYTSVSSKDDIRTGNNYQSVDLDTTLIIGGRPSRNLFFNHVNFRGKHVLDIGANMGESSRLARRRGADLVDGYEYDPFFVETGRMINAVSGATRVSLFQGDATNPALYDGMKYDLVIAFSVWVYIDKLLEKIAGITDAVFFETHTLGHGMDMYTRPMSQHFPHFQIIGYEQQQDMSQSRGVLMFAKTQAALDDALALRKLKTDPYFQNAFLAAHQKPKPGDFVQFAHTIAANLVEDTTFKGIGKPYFELLIAGYFDYVKQAKVTPENVFVRGYRKAIQDGRIDPSLAYLLNDEKQLLARVQKKFVDMDNAVNGRWHLVPPVIVKRGEGKLTFVEESGNKISAENLDGHHRFFMAQLLGRPTIDALVTDPPAVHRKAVHRAHS